MLNVVPYLAVVLAAAVGAAVIGVGVTLIDGKTTLEKWVGVWWAALLAILVLAGVIVSVLAMT